MAAPAPAGSLDAIIADIARRAASESVNEERVAQLIGAALDEYSAQVAGIVASAVAAMPAPAPTHFQISVNGAPAITVQGRPHKLLPRLVKLASATKSKNGKTIRAFPNLGLVGPAGCGKTYLAEQLAEALNGLAFSSLSLAPGLPLSAITGRMVPNLTNGTDEYVYSQFAVRYEHGGVMLFDECDNGDPSTLNAINEALANGHMTLPNGRRIARHFDCIVVLAMNTWGHGASRQYVGRTQLDGAFLDRFKGATLAMDYDGDIERLLCPDDAVRNRVQAIRETCRRLDIQRIVSTRAVEAAYILTAQIGDTVEQALAALAVDWTDEDRRACGIMARVA